MKILLVYPKCPITYWGFQYALKFIKKKASFPPLGLLTIAAMLPKEYEVRLCDMNIENLKNNDLMWADYVFISAMVVQKDSVHNVIERCKKLNVKTVAGGPLFSSEYEKYNDVDYLVIGEGEITMPLFLHDLELGQMKHIYKSSEYADIQKTPVPRWELIKPSRYASMNIQYSRGCPFNCEFCDIGVLFGRHQRAKKASQLISELDALYCVGWRGTVFFVDDNFIGNKKELKNEILPAIINWMKKHSYPFRFLTEVSINLADDEELMKMMVQAGFNNVFIGIETPDEKSLTECNKMQNKNRDLIASVHKIHRFGMEVQAGFIIGFDNDTSTIFDRMISFIQKSGIVTAMVGLLNAPKGTKLYQRLSSEGRLTEDCSGDNTNYTMNFTPKMNRKLLMKGYKHVVDTVYSSKYFYDRVLNFLKNYNFKKSAHYKISQLNIKNAWGYILAFLQSIIHFGVFEKSRLYFWRNFFYAMSKGPHAFSAAIRFSIYGYHFRKVYDCA